MSQTHRQAIKIVGGNSLAGGVTPSGFKHAVVPILAAALTVDGASNVTNVPDIPDVSVMVEIMRYCGATVTCGDGKVSVANGNNLRTGVVPDGFTDSVHGPLYLLPALLSRTGHAQLGQCGGCQIGAAADLGRRPVHHVAEVLRRFGARVQVSPQGSIDAWASKLTACHIDIRDFSLSSVETTGPLVSGATKAAILTAVRADGITTIANPYTKPDVTLLTDFLRNAGVSIQYDDRLIRIDGGAPSAGGVLALPSDLIEVMTFIALSIHLGSCISIQLNNPSLVTTGLAAELALLKMMGVEVSVDDGRMTAKVSDKLLSTDIQVRSTTLYSDCQPLFAAILTRGSGDSMITDHVWRDRFSYADPMNQLGACLEVRTPTLRIRPVAPSVIGQTVTALDLRSAAALVIAALGIRGTTIIRGAEHLERGYQNLLPKLRQLGAAVHYY